MGDGANDLREREEMQDIALQIHNSGRCSGYPNCGFCAGDYHQPELRSRASDPTSSRIAARRGSVRAGSMAWRVLQVIRDCPGVRAKDIAYRTGFDVYDVRKRTADLRNRNLARSQVGPPNDRELMWFPIEEENER